LIQVGNALVLAGNFEEQVLLIGRIDRNHWREDGGEHHDAEQD